MNEPILLGLVGKAGVGKDTLADHLVAHYGFTKMAFADALKRTAKSVFDFSDDQLWGPSELRNAPDLRYPLEDGSHLAPRKVLQTLGTEWARGCYPNIWIELLLRNIRVFMKENSIPNETVGVSYNPRYGLEKAINQTPRIVVTDIRFPNEAVALKAEKAMIIKIESESSLEGESASHASEASIDHIFCDLTLVNSKKTRSVASLFDLPRSELPQLSDIVYVEEFASYYLCAYKTKEASDWVSLASVLSNHVDILQKRMLEEASIQLFLRQATQSIQAHEPFLRTIK